MGEKTEKATPKKMKDAREKGQVAKSQDLPSAFTFIVSVWVTLLTAKTMFTGLSTFIIETFKFIPEDNLAESLPSLMIQSAHLILILSLPVAIAVSLIGCLITFLAVGPVFTFEVFKFDIKKFDPIQNLKAKFKLKTLIELLKSIAKITVSGYIIYRIMYTSLPILIASINIPTVAALLIFNSFLVEVVIKVGLFFLIVAAADFFYQKKSFETEMKMEKFEIKQEYKNSEGDPHIKGKRKQIAQEIAYQDGPTAGVRTAQAVVTNPTHLAIAIGYKREFDKAPYILAMGKDNLAERIILLAERYKIPIVRNVEVAHNLWNEGELYEYVPETTYVAIAEILRWISSLDDPNAPKE